MGKEKNKYGQYFTKADVAEFMVSMITKPTDCKVLEPSCGKGIFLDKLTKYGFENLCAYEIDKSLATNYACVKHESFVSAPTTETYDVAIGNPPYIRWKNIEEELRKELSQSLLWNKYFNSLCDYQFIFILKSIEQLAPNGELIFVCTNYWFNSTHSLSLRNYMCSHGYFESIYLFKETPLFEKVTASFVIFKYVKSSQQKNTIQFYSYLKKGKPTLTDLQNRDSFSYQEIPQFKPNHRWILADKQLQQELEVLERICIKSRNLFEQVPYKIGDVCDIGNGMVSGLDKAFKISETEQQLLNEKENRCLIDVLKAKNLERFNYNSSEKYVYMPSNLSEQEFIETYPNFAKHFVLYKEDLALRYSYNKTIPYWEFVFPRNRQLFKRQQPKIFVPCKERISHKQYFRFCYAPEDFYPLQDVTGIILRDSCAESIEYVLAYLNTKQVFDWLKFNGIVKGEIVEFSEAPIASIPYLPINRENLIEVKLHDCITQEVKAYRKDKENEHQYRINTYFNTLFNEKNSI